MRMKLWGYGAPLLLHPGIQLGTQRVGGAAYGLLHVFVVVAGTDRVAIARAGLKRTALVVRAGLDGRVVVRKEHLKPGQAAGKTSQVLLDHVDYPSSERVGAVNLVVCVELDLQSLLL